MASYGSKYTINWTSPTADCRLWIKQKDYTGGSTALDPAPVPVTIRWGEQGKDDLTAPLRVSTARIRFIGDSQGEMVEEIFDGGDTEYQVKFWRDPNRDGSYELEWEGYLATDLWKDNPHLPAEVIELEAIDGLALLENRTAYTDNSGSGTGYTLSQVFRKVLRGWTPSAGDSAPMHNIPITTSEDWRPDGLHVPSTDDQPLDYLDLPNKAYQELNDRREVEGTLDQRTQLEDLCERLGLQLMLSGGEWRLRQRDQISDGTSLRQWTMGPQDTTFGSVDTADITTNLPAAERTEKPRSRVSRLQRLQSVYSYDDLGELVDHGSFEEGFTGWTQINGSGTVSVLDYDNSDLSVNGTQNDSKVLRLERSVADITNTDSVEMMMAQDVPAVLYYAGPRGAYRFKWDLAIESGADQMVFKPRVTAPDGTEYYLRSEFAFFQQAPVDAADDGEVVVDELPGTNQRVIIPTGSKLRVYKEGQNTAPPEYATFTTTEPARAEDTVLSGDLSKDIPDDGNNYWIEFYHWTTTGSSIDEDRHPENNEVLVPQQVQVPQHTPDGERVVGEMRIELGTYHIQSGLVRLWIDHVSAQVLVGDKPVEQTNYIAEDDQYGREQTLRHRIGDGPTAGHPRGLYDLATTPFFGNWGTGPNPGQTGKYLEQLLVEQWMRQQRETLDRRTYECALRDGDALKPHHVLNFDSKTYTVSFLERNYGTSDDSARVEMTEKKDAGINGLTRAYSMDSSTGSGGGGSTIVNSGDQTIEGASSWSELAGKPSGLLIDPLFDDSKAGVTNLAKDHIADGLDHPTGLDDGIQEFVRGENNPPTDTALVTEKAVSNFVEDRAPLDIDPDGDGTAEIDATLVTVDGDENNIFQQGDQNGELEINVDLTWPNADTVDDYEADELAVRAEDETIPGEWTITSKWVHNARTDFSGEVRHPDWNTGLEHWGIEPDGEADFRFIEVDELRAEAFTADVTQSLAGSDVLTKSAADLASNFSVPDPADGFVTDALHIENVGEVGAQAAFDDGDTIRLRIVDRSGGGLDVLDVWGTAKNYTDVGDGTQKWDFQTASGTNSAAYGQTINKGSRVLDYGKEGDHIIERSVTDLKSPFDRTVRWFDDAGDGVPDRFETETQTGRIDTLPDVSTTDPGFYGSDIRLTDDILAGDLTKQDDFLEYDNGNLIVDGTVFMRDGFIDETVTVGGIGVWPSELPGNLKSLWSGYDDRDKVGGKWPEGRGNDLPGGQEVYPGEEGRISVDAGAAEYIRVDRGGAHGLGSLFVSNSDFTNLLDDGGLESGNDDQGDRSLFTTTTNRATGSTSVIQTSAARSGDYVVEMVKDYDSSGSTAGETTNKIEYTPGSLTEPDYAGTLAVQPTDLSGIQTLEIEVSFVTGGDSTTLSFEPSEGEWHVLPFILENPDDSDTLLIKWDGSDDNVGRLLVDEMALYANVGLNTAAPVGVPFDSGKQSEPVSLNYPLDLQGDFTVGCFLREWTGTDGGAGLQLSGPDTSKHFMQASKDVGKTWSLGTATGIGGDKTKDLSDFPEPDDAFTPYWLFMTRSGDTISMKAVLSNGEVLEITSSAPDVSDMDFTTLTPVAAGSYSAFVDHVLVADAAYSTADCEQIAKAAAPLAPGGRALNNNEATQDGITIRSDTEPTERPDGAPLQVGDTWIDTDDGDKPYNWNGDIWAAAYTAIDGGNIRTGTLTADAITADTITVDELDIGTTLTESILAQNATIEGTLTVGDGNGNGLFVNPGADFEIDENGIDLLVGNGQGNELGFWENSIDSGTKLGFIRAFSGQFEFVAENGTDFDFQANDGSARIYAGDSALPEIELAAGGSSVYARQEDGGLTLIIEQGFQPTDTPPEPLSNEVALYAKEDSNGDVLLYYTDDQGNEYGPLKA